MANLVLKDGKYYGYDPNGGRLYDLDTTKYLDEEKKPINKPNISKEEKNKDEEPLEEKEEKKNK